MGYTINQARNARRETERKRKLGLCTNKGCENKPVDSFLWCKTCREKSRARYRKYLDNK